MCRPVIPTLCKILIKEVLFAHTRHSAAQLRHRFQLAVAKIRVYDTHMHVNE